MQRYSLGLLLWLTIVAVVAGGFTLNASCFVNEINFGINRGCSPRYTDDCGMNVCETDFCETAGCYSGYISYCINPDYFCNAAFQGCYNWYCA